MAIEFTEVGSGPALVLLHAFPLSSEMWVAQRAGLADRARIITPDQRGFGETPLGDAAPSLDIVADDVVALLDRLDLDRVVLGGLSMGGYAAMAIARRHPDRLAGLVLADTKMSADPPAGRENRRRIAEAVTGAAGSRVLLDTVVPTLLGDTTKSRREAVSERVRALVAEASPAAVAWAEHAMAARPDSTETLRSVTVPSLVVVGEEDELAPPADAEAMVEALSGGGGGSGYRSDAGLGGRPEVRLVRIPAAGHLSAMETPDAVNDALRDFLATLR